MTYVVMERDEEHPVKVTSRADGGEEWCTLEYAVTRLGGYYLLSEEELTRALQSGRAFQTVSFIYQLPKD